MLWLLLLMLLIPTLAGLFAWRELHVLALPAERAAYPGAATPQRAGSSLHSTR